MTVNSTNHNDEYSNKQRRSAKMTFVGCRLLSSFDLSSSGIDTLIALHHGNQILRILMLKILILM